MSHCTLPEFVAATLVARAPSLASRWEERARAATPRHPAGGADADPPADRAHAERVLRALADEVIASSAAAALLAGDAAHDGAGTHGNDTNGDGPPGAPPGTDARLSAEVMQLGWQAGGRAFDGGLSVHHVVRDADLLLAIVLTDLERECDPLPAGVVADPAAAFGAARRLQRGMGRYTQAAASGFVHALLRNLRERYRLLRHDLRNPLGTIRSALSLMEDETVPEEMRHGPGIRSMVVRNAGSLDQLIASSLDDAAAAALLIPPQDVALRDMVLAARREVREAARLADCDVVIGPVPAAPPSYVEPAAVELTLTALLLAALTHAGPGDVVQIDSPGATAAGRPGTGELPDGRPCAVLRVSVLRPRGAPDRPRWDPFGLELAISLAADHGGRLGTDPADGTDAAHAESLSLCLPLLDEPAASAAAATPG